MMNWNSEEGRALLWQAYPDGYLAMRGVTTLGGWICLDVMPHPPADSNPGYWHKRWYANNKSAHIAVGWGGITFTFDDMNEQRIDEAQACGDLLPHPDPTDPATWACLLADLAVARWAEWAEGDKDPEPKPYGVPFLAQYERGNAWLLYWGHHDGSTSSFFVLKAGITEDPAEALVRACAQLRKEGK